MAKTTSLPPQCPGGPLLIYEQHPDLGDYIYSPSIDMWSNWRVTSEGHAFRLAGRSRRPSDAQVQLWGSIEAHLEELVTKGVAVIEAPGGMPLRSWFSRASLSLREVRMEPEGETEFFFDWSQGNELYMWPMVTFLGLELKGWSWVV
jgi:hypothetical protein